MNFLEFKKEANRANEAVKIAKANEVHLFAEYMGDINRWSKTTPPVDTVVEFTYYLFGEWVDAPHKPNKVYIGYKKQGDTRMTHLDVVIATGECGVAQAENTKFIWRPILEDLKDTYFSEKDISNTVHERLKTVTKETLMEELIRKPSDKSTKMIEYLGSNWSSL